MSQSVTVCSSVQFLLGFVVTAIPRLAMATRRESYTSSKSAPWTITLSEEITWHLEIRLCPGTWPRRYGTVVNCCLYVEISEYVMPRTRSRLHWIMDFNFAGSYIFVQPLLSLEARPKAT